MEPAQDHVVEPCYRVDASEWPLVVVTPTKSVHDDRGLDAFYATLEAGLKRDEPHVTVFDLRGASSSAKRRRRFAAYCREHEDQLRRLCLAQATVVETALEQGILTAVYWILTPFVPTRAFRTLDEARAWAWERYRESQAGG